MFNTFPYTAFAQNVGLVSLTGVKSRFVATFAGAVLIVLGLIPKLGGIVEGIPQAVLGGAGVALFGMVAASGIRTLTRVKFNNTNILVVAISVGDRPAAHRVADAVQPAPDRVVDRLPLRHLGRGDHRDPAEPAAQLPDRAGAPHRRRRACRARRRPSAGADVTMPVPDGGAHVPRTRSARPAAVGAITGFVSSVERARRFRSPLARLAGRWMARRMAASEPNTWTRLVARVTAV